MKDEIIACMTGDSSSIDSRITRKQYCGNYFRLSVSQNTDGRSLGIGRVEKQKMKALVFSYHQSGPCHTKMGH